MNYHPHLPTPPTPTPVKVIVSLPSPTVHTHTVKEIRNNLLTSFTRKFMDISDNLGLSGGVYGNEEGSTPPYTPPLINTLTPHHDILVIEPNGKYQKGEKYIVSLSHASPSPAPPGQQGWGDVSGLGELIRHRLGYLHERIIGLGMNLGRRVNERVVEMIM